MCLSEFRRLTRVKPCPAVEKLRLAYSRSLRKNPRPLPGLSDYRYPDYWNPLLFLGPPNCTSERDLILCLGEFRCLTRVKPCPAVEKPSLADGRHHGVFSGPVLLEVTNTKLVPIGNRRIHTILDRY